ncbi:hypothetical protein RQP46_003869 [Phenoliferia psychrophenolica]
MSGILSGQALRGSSHQKKWPPVGILSALSLAFTPPRHHAADLGGAMVRNPFPFFHLQSAAFDLADLGSLTSAQLASAWILHPDYNEATHLRKIKKLWRARREKGRALLSLEGEERGIGVYATREERQVDPFAGFELIDLGFEFDPDDLDALSSAQLAALPFHPDFKEEYGWRAERLFTGRRERDLNRGLTVPSLSDPIPPAVDERLNNHRHQNLSLLCLPPPRPIPIPPHRLQMFAYDFPSMPSPSKKRKPDTDFPPDTPVSISRGEPRFPRGPSAQDARWIASIFSSFAAEVQRAVEAGEYDQKPFVPELSPIGSGSELSSLTESEDDGDDERVIELDSESDEEEVPLAVLLGAMKEEDSEIHFAEDEEDDEEPPSTEPVLPEAVAAEEEGDDARASKRPRLDGDVVGSLDSTEPPLQAATPPPLESASAPPSPLAKDEPDQSATELVFADDSEDVPMDLDSEDESVPLSISRVASPAPNIPPSSTILHESTTALDPPLAPDAGPACTDELMLDVEPSVIDVPASTVESLGDFVEASTVSEEVTSAIDPATNEAANAPSPQAPRRSASPPLALPSLPTEGNDVNDPIIKSEPVDEEPLSPAPLGPRGRPSAAGIWDTLVPNPEACAEAFLNEMAELLGLDNLRHGSPDIGKILSHPSLPPRPWAPAYPPLPPGFATTKPSVAVPSSLVSTWTLRYVSGLPNLSFSLKQALAVITPPHLPIPVALRSLGPKKASWLAAYRTEGDANLALKGLADVKVPKTDKLLTCTDTITASLSKKPWTWSETTADYRAALRDADSRRERPPTPAPPSPSAAVASYSYDDLPASLSSSLVTLKLNNLPAHATLSSVLSYFANAPIVGFALLVGQSTQKGPPVRLQKGAKGSLGASPNACWLAFKTEYDRRSTTKSHIASKRFPGANNMMWYNDAERTEARDVRSSYRSPTSQLLSGAFPESAAASSPLAKSPSSQPFAPPPHEWLSRAALERECHLESTSVFISRP